MKKVLIALAIVVYVASSSFAGVSFLVGSPVGEGKLALLGIYGTNHNGNIGGNGDSDSLNVFDTNNLGLRAEYGITSALSVICAYTMDTYPIKGDILGGAVDISVNSGTTTGLGLKYAVAKAGDSFPVDAAVAFGMENSNATMKYTGVKSTKIGQSVMSLAGIFSKRIGICIPYGAVALKSYNANNGSIPLVGQVDMTSGSGLAFNLGCYIGVAENQAVVVEYNTENINWGDTTKSGTKIVEANSINVSGISLGYVYMF